MSFQHIYIYGAGIVASSIYSALWEMYGIRPEKFVVASCAENPDWIDGIPVIAVDEVWDNVVSVFWIIAVPEVYHKDIKTMLLNRGFCIQNMLYVDYRLENMLMERYFKSKGYMTVSDFGEEVSLTCLKKSVEVYQAKCHLDRHLEEQVMLPWYVKPIQVGAALTKSRITQLADNNYEDNISAKNGNYCELTATYHAWRHSNADYKGICHYRRIFDLSDLIMENIIRNGADAILPYPSIHYPDIRSQHSRYIKDSDWEAMMQAVAEEAPEYGADFDSIFSGRYFYNFNMLVAKREVFDDYSRMLFSVLRRAEGLVNPKEKERSDRFAGYMGENLTTLYFIKNMDRLKIVFAGRRLCI